MVTIKMTGPNNDLYKCTWQPQQDELSITLTRDERNLLLYLEARAVDHGGLVQTSHMNKKDMATAKRWNKLPIPGLPYNETATFDSIKFIKFGRLKAEDIRDSLSPTHYVVLSYQAHAIAAALRRKRAMDNVKDIVDEAIRG